MSQQINLYNPIFEQKKKLFGAAAMLQGVVVLVVGCVLLSAYGKQRVAQLRKEADAGARQVAMKTKRLEQVGLEFAPRQKDPELEAELADAQAQLESLRRIAAVLERGELGNTTGYSEYFRALARQHTDGLWLTGVMVAGAGNEISVRGRALDASLVPGYLARLTREPVMQGKSFASLNIDQPQPAAGKDGAPSAPGYVEFRLLASPEGGTQ
jgi:hypothetical protein